MGLKRGELPRDQENRFTKLSNRPTKQQLERLYLEKRLNTRAIGKMFGVSKTSILNWMKECDIPRRSGREMYATRRNPWEKPEYRTKLLEHLKEYWSRSEERSRNTKKLWRDPKFQAKMSQIHKELWECQDYRTKISRGRKRMWRNQEYRSKMIEERKRRWSDSEYKERVIRKFRKSLVKRPTEPERVVIELIDEFSLPFKYTGDGEVVIGGLNPDFVHKEDKKVVEVFGRVFHDPKESFRDEIPWYQQYWGRMARYSQFAYGCLILWDDELDNKEKVIERIRRFIECE